MATVSKEEYLKRYLSSSDGDKKKKRRKKQITKKGYVTFRYFSYAETLSSNFTVKFRRETFYRSLAK